MDQQERSSGGRWVGLLINDMQPHYGETKGWQLYLFNLSKKILVAYLKSLLGRAIILMWGYF